MSDQIKSNAKKNIIQNFIIISVVIFVLNIIGNVILGFTQGYYNSLYSINFKNNFYPINFISLTNPIVLLLTLIQSIFEDIWSTFPVFFHWKFINEHYNWTVYNVFISSAIALSGPILTYFFAKKIASAKNLKSDTSFDILKIIKNSFSLSFKKSGLIIGASILWALTAWIPYLNVGTTIGLFGLVALMSRSDPVSATEIFKAHYRKNMGEFFLLISFIIIGATIGYIFVIIPGIVISIAWSQAIILLVDKGLTPLEAIKKSNEITYGNKVNIFLVYFLVTLIYGFSVGLLFLIATLIDTSLILSGIVGLVGYFFLPLVIIGCSANIYGELTKKLK
tara:strand:- start:1316 stop:2323 length:1008 start_codon:yes stop_codon:yes gene_type:complete